MKKIYPLQIEGSDDSLLTSSTVGSDFSDNVDVLLSDIPNNTVESVLVRMNDFKSIREEKKNLKFRYVWLFGMSMLCFGLVLYEIFNYFMSTSVDLVSQVIFGIIESLALAFAMCGMVICSTVDPSRVNFDSIVEEGNWLSVFFRIATCIILIGDALSWYGVCAIPSVCLMIYNFIFLIPYSCLKVKFTTRFILSMIFDEFVTTISFVYNAYESKTDGNYSGRFLFGIIANTGYPTGSVFFNPWVALSVLCFIEGCLLTCFWIYQLHLKEVNNSKALSPTTVMYISFYMWLNRYGLILIFRGAVCVYYRNQSTCDDSYSYDIVLIITGILTLVPPVGLMILGPTNVFNFTSRRFDRDLQNLKDDGKFIAELLDSVDAELSQSWWVHYDQLSKGQRLGYSDHRKNWYEGVIVAVDERQLTVHILPDENTVLEGELMFKVPRKVKQKSESRESTVRIDDIESPLHEFDMLTFASNNLRCIEWLNMSEELFTKSVRDSTATSLYSLSRPLSGKETISFFISHAWDDDGKQKYQKLKVVAESFKSKYGQYPTFWFDKVCFDQNNISDGLKVLPINVMVCNKVLVLYGPSYPTRLWCIWELFVLFSFADTKEAVRRLQLCPLVEGADLSKNLSTFDVNQAHCYDPNEENKLRKVISASSGAQGDVNEFNLKIQKLALHIQKSSNFLKN